jgi:hypothetical protein
MQAKLGNRGSVRVIPWSEASSTDLPCAAQDARSDHDATSNLRIGATISSDVSTPSAAPPGFLRKGSMIAGTKHLAASSNFNGLEFSTTVRQPLGDSVRDPHCRLLWRGRSFGIGFDIPSPTLSQPQSRLGRVQTAAGNDDPTIPATFQTAGRPDAGGVACRNSSGTGDNWPLDRTVRRAARRPIHAGGGAATQRRRCT